MHIDRRTLLVGAIQATTTLAAMPAAFAQTAASATTVAGDTAAHAGTVTCTIDGKAIARAQVLDWEARRLQCVWQKLRPHARTPIRSELDEVRIGTRVSAASVAQWRLDLLALKQQLGSQRLRDILRGELALSRLTAQLLLATSFGRYALSVIEVQCDAGSAAGFAAWFAGRVKANDEATMLVACPDHHVIETRASGEQYVLETTGGSPLASQFDIDHADAAGNPVVLDPGLPHRVGGVARDGRQTIGYAFHQFGDGSHGGLRGRLSVAFPRSTPWFMITGHQWHLACEFSNWIEAYLRSLD